MLKSLRTRLSYANLTATLALFLALSGGAAYAASHYLITKTSQIKPSVLKALKGKEGPPGPAGPQGVSGLKGENGAPGTNGTNGTNGTAGKDGVSVASKEVKVGEATCNKLGGSEFTAAEGKKTTACNGQTGFTATLPKGATETGDWALDVPVSAAGQVVFTSASFNIPLAAAPVPVYNKEGAVSEHCAGSLESPGAKPGFLCVFSDSHAEADINAEPAPGFAFPKICPLATETNPFSCAVGSGAPAADASGFGLVAYSNEAGVVQGAGTWAVSAE
jgi:hypothetical protein